MSLKDQLNIFKSDSDVYSLLLFILFKTKDIPELAATSELAYILDKENFLKLCEYFGGITIRIPTITEVEDILYAFLLYQYINLEGIEYTKAVDMIERKPSNLGDIKTIYKQICQIMQEYNFNP